MKDSSKIMRINLLALGVIFTLLLANITYAGDVECRFDFSNATNGIIIDSTQRINVPVSVKYSNPDFWDRLTAPYEFELSLKDKDIPFLPDTDDLIHKWQGSLSISSSEVGTWKQVVFYNIWLADFEGLDSDGEIQLYARVVLNDNGFNEVHSSDIRDFVIRPEISGRIVDSGGSPLSGVKVPSEGYGFGDFTDSGGYYSFQVPYGFSGTITPSKTDYTFSPNAKSYSNVISNDSNENYTGTPPDNDGPIWVRVPVAMPIGDNGWVTNNNVLFKLLATDTSGVDKYEYRKGTSGSWLFARNEGSQAGENFYTNVSDSSNRIYQFRAIDKVNNPSGTVQVSFKVDATDPSLQIVSAPSRTLDHTPTIRVSASDSTSGIDHFSFVLYNASRNPLFNWIDNGSSGTYTLSYRSAGTYYWVFAVEDEAGNSTQTSMQQLEIYDPVLTSITIIGKDIVEEGWGSIYTCTAYYSDGSDKQVSPTWSIISGGSYATIDNIGTLRTSSVSKNESCVIQATYGGKTDTHSVTIENKTRIIRVEGNLSFGRINVGTSSARTMTIHNDGNRSLNVSSISYPTGFSGNWTSGTIDAGSPKSVSVTFRPTEAQSYGGTIIVTSDKTSGTSTIACSGDVTRAILTNVSSVSVTEGGTRTFEVRLNVQPPGNVTVSVSHASGDTGISIIAGSTLTFTRTNWDRDQTVRLAAAEDSDAVNGTAIIRCSASGWTSRNVTATENDNDRELVTNTQTVSVTEGGTATFLVRLKARPSSNVQVSVSRVSGDRDISVNSGSMTFTPANWSVYQQVPLAAAEDPDAIDGVCTIRCSAAGWTSRNVTATENDNDREFVTNTSTVTVPEEGTATFQIRLKGEPSGTVAVTVSRLSGDPDITVQSGASLSFNSTNWNNNRTVILAAAKDSDAVNGTATIRCSATGWATKDIIATEDDGQGSFTITSPNGGQTWEQGTPRSITWTSSGNPGSEVRIEYSSNSGSTWSEITASTDNDGAYSWTAPDTASTRFLVRVTSTTKPEITDTSDTIFTVIGSAHHLEFVTQPTDSIATEGTTPVISPSPTVKIVDIAGSTVTSSSANVAVGLIAGGGSSAALVGTTTKAAVSGVATFSDLRITRAGTNFQLDATSGGLTSANSAAFNVVAEPALAIELQDNADPVDPDTQVVYTITYGNTGLAPATNVVISETLPSNLSFVSATGAGTYDAATGTVTWNIGPIPVQTTGRTVTLTTRVKADMADGGTITHSNLTIDCDETGPVTAAAETTTVNDKKGPEISGLIPAADSIQAARNTVIQLHIIDGGSGVEYNGGTVTIQVEGDPIYDGANESPVGEYDSTGSSQAVRGVCTRSGTPADYTFTFTPETPFDYEQKVDVTVNATDKSGNDMPEESYYFYTVMRSFGPSAKVNSDTGTLVQDNPATISDDAGNIWIVWDQTNTVGSTDIYIGKLPADGDSFEPSVPVISNANNQRNPVIMIDYLDRLYVAWEGDDTNGSWDIFVSTSTNGTTWSNPVQINATDPPNNPSDQTSPAIANNWLSPNTLFVAYQDNRAGNYDIWAASSTDGVNWTETQITTDTSNQTEPAIVTGTSGTVHVVWTDARNAGTAGTDIYGADSVTGPWNNVPLINTAANQSRPMCAATGGDVHLLWVDDTDANGSIFYASITGGFPGTVVPDHDLVDERVYGQTEPAIAVKSPPDQWSVAKVFATWQDARYVNSGDPADIYFAETASSFGTNILVNDDAAGNTQVKPAIGIDQNGNPYIVWVDDRNGNNDIYYAGATAIGGLPIDPPIVDPDGTVTIRARDVANLQITIPAGALPDRVDANNITIAEVLNPPAPPVGGFGLNYDFGPSGLQFSQPVTITISHAAANCPGHATYAVYWYNLETATWSQVGITNVQHDETSDPHIVSCQVTHFTTFAVGGSTTPASSGGGGGGGGGGGCSISPDRQGDIGGFFLPYIAYVIVLFVTGWMHARKRRAKSSS